jgi:hypothetical protein
MRFLTLDKSDFQKLLKNGGINRELNNWIPGMKSIEVRSPLGEKVEAIVLKAVCLYRTRFQVSLTVPRT